MSRFNLNNYFALDAILRAPTLTEAARSINLSQPATSLALKSLRAFFNDELVIYKHGRAELTPLATLLQPRVADILKASREVVALSRAFDPATDTRTLIVAAPDEFGRLLLPAVLASIAAAAPGIRIEIVPWIRSGNSAGTRPDVSILPAWAADPNESCATLTVEIMGCLAEHDSGLSELPDETEYFSCEHVALRGDEDLYRPGSPAALFLKERKIARIAPSLEALPHILRGRLLATASMRFTQSVAASSGLLAIPAPAILAPVPFVIQSSPTRQDEPPVRWLIDHILRAQAAWDGVPLDGARAAKPKSSSAGSQSVARPQPIKGASPHLRGK